MAWRDVGRRVEGCQKYFTIHDTSCVNTALS